MVEVTTNNGVCGLESSIVVDQTLVEVLKDPQYKERINNLQKELKISHRIEEKDGKFISIAGCNAPSRFGAIEACNKLEAQHQEFLDQLIQMRHEKNHDEAGTTDDEEEDKFLDYAMMCALRDILGEFGMIIVAIPK